MDGEEPEPPAQLLGFEFSLCYQDSVWPWISYETSFSGISSINPKVQNILILLTGAREKLLAFCGTDTKVPYIKCRSICK